MVRCLEVKSSRSVAIRLGNAADSLATDAVVFYSPRKIESINRSN